MTHPSVANVRTTNASGRRIPSASFPDYQYPDRNGCHEANNTDDQPDQAERPRRADILLGLGFELRHSIGLGLDALREFGVVRVRDWEGVLRGVLYVTER